MNPYISAPKNLLYFSLFLLLFLQVRMIAVMFSSGIFNFKNASMVSRPSRPSPSVYLSVSIFRCQQTKSQAFTPYNLPGR